MAEISSYDQALKDFEESMREYEKRWAGKEKILYVSMDWVKGMQEYLDQMYHKPKKVNHGNKAGHSAKDL